MVIPAVLPLRAGGNGSHRGFGQRRGRDHPGPRGSGASRSGCHGATSNRLVRIWCNEQRRRTGTGSSSSVAGDSWRSAAWPPARRLGPTWAG